MKKYKIKYQLGNDIYIKDIKAYSKIEARYVFCMNVAYTDILSIEEVKEGEANG